MQLADEIVNILNNLAPTFEYYLPDEKISMEWQETEVISTHHPEFEVVYFERDIDDTKMYISNDYEFFPVYALYLTLAHGRPTVAKEGLLIENDLIKMEAGDMVMVVGFSDQNRNTLEKVLPPLEDQSELTKEDLIFLARPYLDELKQ